ncbi:peptidoglycan/LPS O-acetylase OafA/YrhL [Nonomuraea thailandensis]|uniref:Peptidoglycan/LPS O-acetylase OafA/YrhL n=1 Tax=Nonomuraea thailandensis TaxID=1188745 RepID=A0A9X2GUB8_9ACTN|nr:acyltransferase [Nonomuraea thailandensis]MCP2364140.1 peptidoglycan/LPS O-acetylase OafA/YrhL [Nonomuraea thailandensis]
MYTVLRGIRRRAEQAPPSRERFIDLLRAISIVAVVLGHWLVATVGYDRDGELNGRSALPELPWAHPLTWLVQVMPVFFLVGGYANAASLAAVRRRGGNATGWLLNRSGRLLRPTTALVLVTAGGALAARLFGADPARVRLVAWFASIPLWFLVAYLAVVVLTPVMYALHRRYGLAVPVVLVCLVALGDVARLLGEPFWGNGNFLFGWLAVHQMGFAWRDGLLPSRARVALPLVCGGAGLVLVLTLAGPYPVSMINVPGERLHNMSPPSLALLGVAATQLGVALLLRERGERWLRVSRVWIAVVAVNAVILTIFLWHVSAAILLAAALHAAGVLPVSEAGSAAWFAWRLPLLVMLGLVLVLLVAIAGPIEVRRTGRISGPPPWLVVPVVAGFAAVIAGLLGNSLLPSTSPTLFGWPTPALIAYLAGTAVLRLLRRTSDS